MATLTIRSKKHGIFEVLVDDDDLQRIAAVGKTLKWCARVVKGRHNLVYFQKRLSNGRLVELHRFIMGFPQGMVVDHINGNTLDNRKGNLRICTNASNIRKGRVRTNNTSGYTGVLIRRERIKRPYYAKIRVGYKIISLGTFETFEDAYQARKKAEIKYLET